MVFRGADFARDFQALSDLLKGPEDDRRYEEVSNPSPAPSPASVGPKGLIPNAVPPTVKPRKDNQAIWGEDELDGQGDDFDDGRIAPNYEFLYKQAVATTDAFLGMSHKDPSSTCCEDMVVRIELPGTQSVKDIDLDVKETSLRLSSPKYKLSLHLPHKVEGDKGKAEWDAKKQQLSVSLPIVREDL